MLWSHPCPIHVVVSFYLSAQVSRASCSGTWPDLGDDWRGLCDVVRQVEVALKVADVALDFCRQQRAGVWGRGEGQGLMSAGSSGQGCGGGGRDKA